MKLRAFFFLLFLPSLAFSKPEAFHRDAWAEKLGGKTEVIMSDKSRCDIVTETHAIEVEKASKWKHAIGQALWYAFQTSKKAGIVLIIEDEDDKKHLLKLRSLIEHNKLSITVFSNP